MMTGVAAALAAPLIGLAGADGFGIHFYEQSSAGKTTTANVAASLYGNPDVLRLTWYGTALGLANEAAAHNDALMPLDEIGGARTQRRYINLLMRCSTAPGNCRSQRGREPRAETLAHCSH